MKKISFSNEIKNISNLLNSHNLSKTELLAIKYALFQLTNYFPEKESFLLQKAAQVQSKINALKEGNLSQKIIKLIN